MLHLIAEPYKSVAVCRKHTIAASVFLAFAVNVELTSNINVTKPYKPRKLKMDPYHVMMRRARKYKHPSSIQKQHSVQTRKRWIQRNKSALERRRQYVDKMKKHLPKT